jgi:hypothetical protein
MLFDTSSVYPQAGLNETRKHHVRRARAFKSPFVLLDNFVIVIILSQAYLASQTQKCTYGTGRRGESNFSIEIFTNIRGG